MLKLVMVNRFSSEELENPCEGFEYGTFEHTTQEPITIAVADPGFSRGGGARQLPKWVC